jgi:MoaA/NifB/PqqE/SkfB family radical SAM enzyme
MSRPDDRDSVNRSRPRDTFCILPWSHLYVDASGSPMMCCLANDAIRDGDGTPFSLYTHTAAEIRNSGYMTEVRRKMVAGESVTACQPCYDQEARDGCSERTVLTAKFLTATNESADDVKARAIDEGYRVSTAPASFHLLLGNLCNLACRMCSSGNSSRIDQDPVHSRWSPAHPLLYWTNDAATIGPRLPLGVAPSGFNAHELLFSGDMLGWTDGCATLSLPLDQRDTVVSIEIQLGDPVPAALGIAITLNGRTAFRQSADRPRAGPTSKRIVIDTSTLHLGAKLAVTIVSWKRGRKRQRVRVPIVAIRVRRTSTSNPRELVVTRFADRRHGWAEQDEVLFGEVLAHPRRLRWLNVTGGEPLLHKRFLAALEYLDECGCTETLELTLNTNCTTVDEDILERLERFPKLRVALSIDGCGAAYEYIRFPAKWPAVFENAKALTARLKGRVFAVPVVQAYNLTTIADMMRLFDSIGLDFALVPLTVPEYLSVAVLPRSAVAEAADAITRYAQTCANETRRAQMTAFVSYLDRLDPAPTLRPTFMKFTNDLDRSRGQNFCETYPGLVRHLAQDGTPWDAGGRFALPVRSAP